VVCTTVPHPPRRYAVLISAPRDKTGTITMNQLAVTGVIPLEQSTEADALFDAKNRRTEAVVEQRNSPPCHLHFHNSFHAVTSSSAPIRQSVAPVAGP